MLYVYAIADHPAPPELRGLLEASLQTIGRESPFGIVSEHPDPSIGPTEEDLWTYEQVVEGLMEGGSALPMRFGTTVSTAEELLRVLSERRREFETSLDRVRGAVELGVRARVEPRVGSAAASDPGSGGGTGPGAAYLQERLESERHRATVSVRIHEVLASLARRTTQGTRGGRPDAFNASYLVDRDRVDAFRNRVEELATDIEGVAIACTGPWPPYSFSSAEEAE